METNQAAEHLQVIRTLMERSALYRRALAPIMTYCGILGIVGGITGWALKINMDFGFIGFWCGVAAIASIGSLLFVRRQAFKQAESFWSPPTKRVAQAMLPPFFIGFFLTALSCFHSANSADPIGQSIIALIWSGFYGCAVHSAGFSISRGFRIFGWIFILLSCVLAAFVKLRGASEASPYCLMAGMFGGLHLTYGIYLYFTENRNIAP